MTTKDYRTKYNLLSSLYLIPLFGIGIAVLLIVSNIDIWISHRVTLDRGFVFLISAPFICGGFILGSVIMNLLDKRIGIRCPMCGRSLILNCSPSDICTMGVCPDCKVPLFTDAPIPGNKIEKRSPKGTDLAPFKNRKSWEQMRKLRRKHFILTRFVLLLGLPLGMVFFGIAFFVNQQGNVLGILLICILGCTSLGWAYGDYIWQRRERAFGDDKSEN